MKSYTRFYTEIVYDKISIKFLLGFEECLLLEYERNFTLKTVGVFIIKRLFYMLFEPIGSNHDEEEYRL